MRPKKACIGRVFEGVLQSCCQSGCRKVLVVTLLVLAMFFPLIIHHRESTILPLPVSEFGMPPQREVLLNNLSPTISPSRPGTSERKDHTHKVSSTEKKKHQDDPLKDKVILRSWPPKVKFPLMAFTNIGRLGNRLNSYATALTFQPTHKDSATIAVTRETMLRLLSLLEPGNLTLPVVDKTLLNEAKNNSALVHVNPTSKKNDQVSHMEPAFQKAEEEYRKNGIPKVYAMGGYPNRMWKLAGHHDTIRDTFRFREDLKQKTKKFFEDVRQKNGRQDITFVGFHIRRTDYTRFIKNFYKCNLPGPAFYQSAMNHYRATLKNPVFVVTSDNMTYARQHLNGSSDVVFSDMKTAAEDMALLGSCSHSVMTVGTFGFWASFFAGGQVLYPLLINCTSPPFVHRDTLGPRGYENWIPFDVDGGGPV